MPDVLRGLVGILANAEDLLAPGGVELDDPVLACVDRENGGDEGDEQERGDSLSTPRGRRGRKGDGDETEKGHDNDPSGGVLEGRDIEGRGRQGRAGRGRRETSAETAQSASQRAVHMAEREVA